MSFGELFSTVAQLMSECNDAVMVEDGLDTKIGPILESLPPIRAWTLQSLRNINVIYLCPIVDESSVDDIINEIKTCMYFVANEKSFSQNETIENMLLSTKSVTETTIKLVSLALSFSRSTLKGACADVKDAVTDLLLSSHACEFKKDSRMERNRLKSLQRICDACCELILASYVQQDSIKINLLSADVASNIANYIALLKQLKDIRDEQNANAKVSRDVLDFPKDSDHINIFQSSRSVQTKEEPAYGYSRNVLKASHISPSVEKCNASCQTEMSERRLKAKEKVELLLKRHSKLSSKSADRKKEKSLQDIYPAPIASKMDTTLISVLQGVEEISSLLSSVRVPRQVLKTPHVWHFF